MFQVFPFIQAYSVYNTQRLIRNTVAYCNNRECIIYFLRNEDIVLTFLCSSNKEMNTARSHVESHTIETIQRSESHASTRNTSAAPQSPVPTRRVSSPPPALGPHRWPRNKGQILLNKTENDGLQ